MSERSGVESDDCPSCRGVWLHDDDLVARTPHHDELIAEVKRDPTDIIHGTDLTARIC